MRLLEVAGGSPKSIGQADWLETQAAVSMLQGGITGRISIRFLLFWETSLFS